MTEPISDEDILQAMPNASMTVEDARAILRLALDRIINMSQHLEDDQIAEIHHVLTGGGE